MTIIKEQQLANGLLITFSDESNRYFGDYHRVCVVATIVCTLKSLPGGNSADETFCHQAIEALGEQLSVVRRFERMGVATADVEEVRSALISGFLDHASAYLGRPEYPRALVNAALKKRRTQSFYA